MITVPYDWFLFVNVGLLVWFLIVLYRGYQRGLLLQLVDIMSSLVALFAAWILSPVFVRIFPILTTYKNGSFIINNLMNAQLNRLLWTVILFIAFKLVFLLVSPIAQFVSKIPLIKQVNSWIGGIFSIGTYVFQMIILVFVLTTPIFSNGVEVVNATLLKHVEPLVEPIIHSFNQTIETNAALQSLVYQQSLTPSQEDAMVAWLLKHGISEQEIREFLGKHE